MPSRSLSVRLNARLGNQMFEYSFARALSIQLGIDHSYLVGKDDNRLDCFALSDQVQFTNESLSLSWLTIGARRVMGKLAAILAQRPATLYCTERVVQPLVNLCGVHFCLDGYLQPNIQLLKSNHLYCAGYFQSERYFHNYDDIIRSDFTFLPTITDSCKDWANQIRACNAVCLHIRLGDFLSLPQYQVCDADYYRRAIDLMLQHQPDAHFFLFSDDPDRALNLLNPSSLINSLLSTQHHSTNLTLIPSTLSDQQSLYLGTLCRHHILSNSSFSWWMQYLAHHPDQIVIAPHRWMADDTPVAIQQSHWNYVN